MNKRKILILIGSMAILLAVVGLYSLIGPTLGIEEKETEIPVIVKRPKLTKVATGGASEPTHGSEFWSEDRDPFTGKLKRIYRVKQWNKRGEGIYELVEPHVVIYQRNGQQITITADRGQVVGEEIAGKPQVQSGLLEGNVKIFYDRDDDAGRHDDKGILIPAEKRPNVVRIYVDSLRFDSADLEIYTDSYVTLFAKEADIYGKGLRLLWKENPEELRRLEIMHGERMVVHQLKGSQKMFALPGKETGHKKEMVKTASKQKQDKKTFAASAKTQPVKNKKPVKKNVFLAEFFAGDEKIEVTHDQESLVGADKLRIKFRFKASSESLDSQQESYPEKVAVKPNKDIEKKVAATKTEVPATQDTVKPLVIKWNGPLVLKPVEYSETSKKEKYNIESFEADGEDLVLSDSKTTIICQKARYDNLKQIGTFWGVKDGKSTATIKMEGGEEIVSRSIEFDRAKGVAWLWGEGYMTRPVTGSKDESGGEKITWTKSVLVSFGTSEGNQKNKYFLKRATFNGDVVLTQNNNVVRGQKLVVSLARTSDGKIYPTQADVSGNAHAMQDGSNIKADNILVTFRPTAESKSGQQLVKGVSQSVKVEPVKLLAKGNVVVTDKRGEEQLFAEGNKLTCDLIVAKARIEGSPARVGQGVNVLCGKNIDMWQEVYELVDSKKEIKKHYVQVNGAGNLVFLTDRGLNSNKFAQPRKIRIDWNDRMYYHPQQLSGQEGITDRNLAEFYGDVKVVSSQDSLSSQFLEVEFFERVKEEGGQKVKGETKRKGSVQMASYSSQELIKITAKKGVEMAINERLPDDILARRLVVNGDHLVYDVPAGVVNMFSAGTLMNEDYREPKTSSDTSEMSVDRPNLTAFEWKDSMVLDQNSRQAVLKGDVSMVHRSGRKVVDIVKRLGVKTCDWKMLPEGRHTKIFCQDMLVQFGPPERDTSQSNTEEKYDVGSKIGPLNLFKATGNVDLWDGAKEVVAQVVTYDRLGDIVKIFGYIEGRQSPANAMLREVNLIEMTEKIIESPVIIWHRKNNVIKTGAISAGG